jgi:MoaA/NifB/PqqE/SkfB family radical SAM enzyme
MARKIFIQWDSTNDCNLKCSHCYHNREEGEYFAHRQKDNLMSLEEVIFMQMMKN